MTDTEKKERCPARESGGHQCELPAGHHEPHACTRAKAAAGASCEILLITPAFLYSGDKTL